MQANMKEKGKLLELSLPYPQDETCVNVLNYNNLYANKVKIILRNVYPGHTIV